jgi:hypothetical protein
MKKILFLLLFLGAAQAAQAQSLVKKYVLLEHFTNSRCSNCASRNPAFYDLIEQYPSDVHHIAYHPPIPYSNCIFYQANTVGNNARTNHYGIASSPRLVLNGTLVNGGTMLLPSATLTNALGATSPLYVQVLETSGTNRTATITLRSVGDIPSGNYKLYAAVVEKLVNYASPNGELQHHDVFRQMLPGNDGQAFTPAALGQEQSFSFNYTVANGWQASETYVVAFVQNTDTKAILNSGTRFDPIVLSADEPLAQVAKVWPNPTDALAFAQIGTDRAVSVEAFALNGQRSLLPFENQALGTLSFNTDQLQAGIYVLKITGENGVHSGKVVVRR